MFSPKQCCVVRLGVGVNVGVGFGVGDGVTVMVIFSAFMGGCSALLQLLLYLLSQRAFLFNVFHFFQPDFCWKISQCPCSSKVQVGCTHARTHNCCQVNIIFVLPASSNTSSFFIVFPKLTVGCSTAKIIIKKSLFVTSARARF